MLKSQTTAALLLYYDIVATPTEIFALGSNNPLCKQRFGFSRLYLTLAGQHHLILLRDPLHVKRSVSTHKVSEAGHKVSEAGHKVSEASHKVSEASHKMSQATHNLNYGK